ncbi:hypothetical protein ACP70R_011292 [Stipagrostis hirtigluma subsp. patula]
MGIRVHCGEISSADKNLVVLYTGSYRPGNGGFSGDGCYLVYDASNNALSAIPPLSDSPTINGLGRTAAILRRGGDGAYVLAELVTTCDLALPGAELFFWSSSVAAAASTENPGGQWSRRAVRLPLPPHLSGPTYIFEVDMAFSFAGSYICWADLLTGVLIRDLSSPQSPQFTFVPLPEGCCLDIPHSRRLGLKPEEFRSMGCACGAIKFVDLIGYPDDACPSNGVTLKTWTLSHDFKEWKEGKALCVRDIWSSESFNEMQLPHVMPMFPVLSMDEEEVIYAVLNVIERVDDVDEFGDILGVDLVPKAHYLIRHDMVQNKVLTSAKSSATSYAWLRPTLFASEFSAYLRDKGPSSNCSVTTSIQFIS